MKPFVAKLAKSFEQHRGIGFQPDIMCKAPRLNPIPIFRNSMVNIADLPWAAIRPLAIKPTSLSPRPTYPQQSPSPLQLAIATAWLSGKSLYRLANAAFSCVLRDQVGLDASVSLR